jgi:hypothetical protein
MQQEYAAVLEQIQARADCMTVFRAFSRQAAGLAQRQM